MNFLFFLATGNASNVTGGAEKVSESLKALTGNWEILVAAIALIIITILILVMFEDIIGNAILGIIALLILKYALGIPIPLTPLVILITVLGGMGGVGALLIATFFGWL